MQRRRSAVVGPLAGAIALGVLAICFIASQHGEPEAAPDVAGQSLPRAAARQGRVTDSEMVRAAIDAPSIGNIRVRVVSETGLSLARVQLATRRASQPLERVYRHSSATILGFTTTLGFLDVARADVIGSVVTAWSPGYQVTEVVIPESYAETQLQLSLLKGGRLSVVCKQRDGTPLADVELSLSRSPLDHGRRAIPEFRDLRPCGDADVAVYSEVTGLDGAAHFDGLPSGELFLQPYHHSCVVVEGLPEGVSRLDPQHHEVVNLVFDPVYCAIAVIANDSLLAWGASCPDGMLLRPDLVDRLRPIRVRWESAYDHPVICVAGVARFDGARYIPPAASALVDLFTVERGWSQVSAPIWPLSPATTPDVLTLGGDVGRVRATDISFCLVTPSGREIECLEGITVKPLREDGARSFLDINVSRRASRMLPVGRYEVGSAQPVLNRALDGLVLDIGNEERVRIPVPLEVSPCCLVFKLDSGLEIDAAKLTLTAHGKSYQVVMTQGLAGRVLHLPVGELTVDVIARTGGRLRTTIHVPISDRVVRIDAGVVKQ